MLGRPLQPNPAGGPPTVPQALNRYAATSLGQPGVAEGVSGGGIPPVFVTTGLSAASAGAGMGLGYYAHDLYGYLNILANKELLARAHYSNLFKSMGRVGRNTRFESQSVRQAEGRTFQVIDTDKIISLDVLEAKAKNGWPVKYQGPNGEAFVPLNDTRLKGFLRSAGGEFGANFVLNMALAIPEMAAPWQDPYFTTRQRVTQNVFTVGSVLAGTYLAIKVGAATLPLGGPVSFVIVTGTGIVFVVAWNAIVPPIISSIYYVVGAPDPYHRERRLQPLP